MDVNTMIILDQNTEEDVKKVVPSFLFLSSEITHAEIGGKCCRLSF